MAIKDSSTPRIRCTKAMRKETEQCADRLDKKLSEYIYDAVEAENNKVKAINEMVKSGELDFDKIT